MTTIRILHLDDDAMALHGIEARLKAAAADITFDICGVTTVEECMATASRCTPDLFLLDLHLNGDGSGIRALEAIREAGFAQPVLILSSDVSSAQVKAAMRAGAVDFVTKDEAGAELAIRIHTALSKAVAVGRVAATNKTLAGGDSMRRVAQRLDKIVGSRVNSVLVRGETGTGKEVVAECLKDLLPAGVPFVPVNCAAISQSVMESELFGHEKAAFTGATASRPGIFATAHRGWIFLDEVARLTLECQAALLRVLDSGEIRPVGSSVSKRVDVRIIAATNEDLAEMVERGLFRRDLLARLAGVEIHLLPLRDRRHEISDIIDVLLVKLNEHIKAPIGRPYRLASSARSLMKACDWHRGNVREMRQALLAATIDANDGLITVGCLPQYILDQNEPDASKYKVGNLSIVSSQPSSAHCDVAAPHASTALVLPQLTASQARFPISLLKMEGALLIQLLKDLAAATPYQKMTQRNIAHNLGITRYTLFAKARQLQADGLLPSEFEYLLPSTERVRGV